MVAEHAISVSGASMGYRHGPVTRVVLHDVNVLCRPGSLVAVVGINGSGKSTLLRGIGGLMTLLSGTVKIFGRELAAMTVRERARTSAIVLTERPSGFNLTVWDVVATGQMPYTDAFHRLREQHVSVISEALRQTGMHEHRHLPVGQLSDGMLQKTMIARALAQQTNVILLDEPLAFLDYRSRHELLMLLRTLCVEQRKCILFTTHDLDLLQRYCTDALIVAEGSVTACSVDQLKEQPLFIQIGGGYL